MPLVGSVTPTEWIFVSIGQSLFLRGPIHSVWPKRPTRAIAEANEAAGSAHERAATLEKEAAVLRWQLDLEIQKRAPRLLTDEQKTALLAELRGKISDINIVVQRDVEAQAFAMQLEIVLQESGALLHPYKMAAGETLPAPGGLVMYKPGGTTSEDDMKDDPLYRALKAAHLFGGSVSGPFLSIEQLIMGQRLPPDQHILYVGQKPPF